MKAFRIIMIAAFLFALVGMTPQNVSAEKFTGYTSLISLANTSTSIAHITLDYYNTSPVGVTSASDTIDPLKSKAYFPLSTPPSGFSGSVVVSSDQPLASISNMYASSESIRASYTGTSAGAPVEYLPLLMHANGANPNDTWFMVQNVGTATTSVSIAYSDGCSVAAFPIEPGYSYKIDNALETCHATSGPGGVNTPVFAGTVTSVSQPIAIAVLQEKNPSGGLGGVMYAWTGYTTSGSSYPVFPIVTMNNSNNQSGISILNTGGSTTDVTVAYTPAGAGTACTETKTLEAGEVLTYGWPAFWATVLPYWEGTSDCIRNEKFVGGARVTVNTADMPLQTIVNQPKYTTSRADSYRAFSYTDATTNDGTPRIVMPLIMDHYGTDLLYTNTNVTNLSSTTAYVKCFFEGTPTTTFTYDTGTGGLAANGGTILVLGYNNLGTNFIGSGYCQTYTDNTYTTPSSSGKLVGVVNEVTQNSTNLLDTLMIYEAVNVGTTVP
jgi:hypothetical protein